MRTVIRYGACQQTGLEACQAPPDKMVDIPQVDVLNVGFHPAEPLSFVDTAAHPVVCVVVEVTWSTGEGVIWAFAADS